LPFQTAPGTRKQYIHLTLYRCENCKGAIVAASLGTRESEIARESELTLLGAACLSCGNRQPSEPELIRRFPPVQWETAESLAALGIVVPNDEGRRPLHRADLAPAIP